MADSKKFEAIVGEIGRKLWSIFPEDAVEMQFEAQFHEWMTMGGVSHWTKRNGERGRYLGFGSRPEQLEQEIKADLAEMRTLDIFQQQPWNHVTVTLNEKGKINLQYAYIEDVDYWPRLHLRGVSDLDQAEAFREYGVPPADWMHIASEVLRTRRAQTEAARALADPARLNYLEQAISGLQHRIDTSKIQTS